MRYFFDASSLVKRYVNESGSDEVDEIVSGEAQIFCAWHSFPECLATFGRLAREKLVSKDDRKTIEGDFLEDWARFDVVREATGLETIVRRICTHQPLRGGDAVQLAAAMFLRERGLNFHFVCSDRQLANVAEEEGFKVMRPGILGD